MGFGMFHDPDEDKEDWSEFWRFHEKICENEPQNGETKKEHCKRCLKWLINEEGYTLSEAKEFCRLIWERYIYRKRKTNIEIADIKFPLQYYLDKGLRGNEIKKVMRTFFAKKKYIKEKSQNHPKSFKISNCPKKQYELGRKIGRSI